MTPEGLVRQIEAARIAVDQGARAQNDEVLANQLALARNALEEMLDSLADGGPPGTDKSWLGQMVADQWDPQWPLTEIVLRAAQAYSTALASTQTP